MLPDFQNLHCADFQNLHYNVLSSNNVFHDKAISHPLLKTTKEVTCQENQEPNTLHGFLFYTQSDIVSLVLNIQYILLSKVYICFTYCAKNFFAIIFVNLKYNSFSKHPGISWVCICIQLQ